MNTQSRARAAWQPIADARKDGTTIWAVIRADLVAFTGREDLDGWAGCQLPIRHTGVYTHEGREWDHGWGVAAPVGCGGFPDAWIAGWMPLPEPPEPNL